MFSFTMAILISFIFELLRISALYSITMFDGFYRGLSLALYIMISFICFSAAALNFSSSIIEKAEVRHVALAKAQTNDLFLIKNTYSKKIDAKIAEVQKHKIQMDSALAKYPDSKTWSEKVQQDVDRIRALNQEREEYFKSIQSSRTTSEWISNQKAILGLSVIQDVYDSETSSISKAANELYGIDDIKLQKFAALSLTGAVEIGIVLLMILGTNIKEEEEIKEEIVEEKPELKKKEKKGIPKIKNKEAVPLFFE